MVPFRSMYLRHAVASRVVKGEDVVTAVSLDEAQPQNMLYLVCDGHVGKHAAKFVSANFQQVLMSKLPTKLLDRQTQPSDVAVFAEQIRRILCETFAELDNALYRTTRTSGTAVTALLVLGPLVTVANIGDCAAVLDTGCFRMELTNSHRLVDSASELARLKTAGCHVAPLGFHFKGPAKPGEQGVGPLRIWPGGLCVARTIGDFDSGPHVSPIPHIKQVLFEEHTSSCRIVLASDGLWDVLSFRKALSLVRTQPIWSTAAELVRIASQNHKIIDDTSVVVLDVTRSQSEPAFNVTAYAARRSEPEAPQPPGLFCCMRPAVVERATDNSISQDPNIPKLYADVDGLLAYPMLRATLLRNQHNSSTKPPPQASCFLALGSVAEEQGKGATVRVSDSRDSMDKTESRSSTSPPPGMLERKASDLDVRVSERPSTVLERHSSAVSSKKPSR